MADDETIDCNVKQWQSEIKRQHEAGEVVIKVRSNLGGVFPLGELPNDQVAETLNIISV